MAETTRKSSTVGPRPSYSPRNVPAPCTAANHRSESDVPLEARGKFGGLVATQFEL
jgi:hypothetical protein